MYFDINTVHDVICLCINTPNGGYILEDEKTNKRLFFGSHFDIEKELDNLICEHFYIENSGERDDVTLTGVRIITHLPKAYLKKAKK